MTIQIKDGAAATKYLKATGAGGSGDPYIPEHLETNSADILTAAEAIQVAVEALDNIVAGSEAQVDVVTSALPTGAATAAKQDTIISHIDGVEALLTTIDADTGAVAAAVDGSEMQVDVVGALPAGEAHLGEVGGRTVSVAVTLTRPANTTAYAALDAVADSDSSPNALTFSNVARINQGSGIITFARLMTNQSTNVARFRLHLFTVAPTPINDNAAYTLLWANRATRIGVIDFDACQTEGSGSDAANSQNMTVRLPFNAAAADRNLYALLETRDAFTPASAQVFYIELRAELN